MHSVPGHWTYCPSSPSPMAVTNHASSFPTRFFCHPSDQLPSPTPHLSSAAMGPSPSPRSAGRQSSTCSPLPHLAFSRTPCLPAYSAHTDLWVATPGLCLLLVLAGHPLSLEMSGLPRQTGHLILTRGCMGAPLLGIHTRTEVLSILPGQGAGTWNTIPGSPGCWPMMIQMQSGSTPALHLRYCSIPSKPVLRFPGSSRQLLPLPVGIAMAGLRWPAAQCPESRLSGILVALALQPLVHNRQRVSSAM